MKSAIIRDVMLSFVRVHILHHAAKEAVYGLAMIEELRRHGYDLSPGTLYPILHGMEQSGLLKCEHEVVSGKVRKYYTATAKGRRTLEELQGKIKELFGELFEE
ncbi:MAG: PadR family transcriptional regulator [Betaproteobacteria bacterium]|nr:PadR family transcriptional regulator [Betaproteobacteria bacterium]